MIGNSTVVLQLRDRKLLELLENVRLLDRELISELCGFSSKTRANARLHALTKAGLLKRRFLGTISGGRRAVYMLPGRNAPQPRAGVASSAHAYHDLEVSRVYAAIRRLTTLSTTVEFREWRLFDRAVVSGLPLIPDAYFELRIGQSIYGHFVEVDRGTEPLRTWKTKGQHYLDLAASDELVAMFGQASFRVLVIAPSGRRVENIRQALSMLTDRVFWFAESNVINRDGLSASIWLRPFGVERRSLL